MNVMLDVRARHWAQNPYIDVLVENISERGVDVLGFSWRRALFGKYDVVHAHWPEYLVKYQNPLVRYVAFALSLAWITRLKYRGIPVIRTRHNKNTHESSLPSARYFLRLLNRACIAEIRMNRSSVESLSPTNRVVYIPHGDYLSYIRRTRSHSECPVDQRPLSSRYRLLCFGMIRRYKNYEDVLRALQDDRGHAYLLRIVGETNDVSYAEELTKLAYQNPLGSELSLRRLGDKDLLDEISLADTIVIPYEDVYNSGALFMALSMGKPVLARRSIALEELEVEFGSQWISLYDGYLTDEDIARHAKRTSNPSTAPDFSSRTWASIGRAHVELYRSTGQKC